MRVALPVPPAVSDRAYASLWTHAYLAPGQLQIEMRLAHQLAFPRKGATLSLSAAKRLARMFPRAAKVRRTREGALAYNLLGGADGWKWVDRVIAREEQRRYTSDRRLRSR